MLEKGLEPLSLAALVPKTSAYTNSATPAVRAWPKHHNVYTSVYQGVCAQGGTRTHTVLLPGDFKSPMSTIPSPGQYSVVETRARIELAHRDFADLRLTTWPSGLIP